ncbi:hypothetical protein FQN57_004354 [Myotisia sp. PD_48]|nr:hypothetical protein FQN57_004354 [Myotisia sp. PD_48]
MSSKLWQYFLQDDVERFRDLLANATYVNTHKTARDATGTSRLSLDKSLGSSPRTQKTNSTPRASSFKDKNSEILARADVNAKDQYGRTLLHHIASSRKESAFEFATALLAVRFIDIYVQDLESGWNALHRAIYNGNVSIAQAILARELKDATDITASGGTHHAAGTLIKAKDRDGNTPFEVFAATIVPEATTTSQPSHSPSDGDSESDSTSEAGSSPDYGLDSSVIPRVHIEGDEIFTFGSNKNLSLGVGDEDDRQFPQRIGLRRPDHLFQRFHDEKKAMKQTSRTFHEPQEQAHQGKDDTASSLPILIRSKPVVIQDVVMSKLHSAILTNDPESNLYMCGFGPTGRLGTGDEATRFNFVCVESGALSGKRIISVSLGQDHTIAVSDKGEVFSWGSNKYGQLGYSLPKSSHQNDVPIQISPRQIFNPFKRETIVGAATSSIHSAVYTSTALYTFGKNDGQLGFMDADARSLEAQIIPRKIGASFLNCRILSVSAIDRATVCLLETHDVWVFSQYGYSKVIFPLSGFSNFIKNSFSATRYGSASNRITKITSGGNTICAMSSFGEVYTVGVSRNEDTPSAASSTTNPAKIRNSLPQPSRAWAVKKSHMAARDVAMGQDGSIIVCTEAGTVWLKEKRLNFKQVAGETPSVEIRAKDVKFVRVLGISRAVAVRSNAFGAYSIVQRGLDIAKKGIIVEDRKLWQDLQPLLPYNDLVGFDALGHVQITSASNGAQMLEQKNAAARLPGLHATLEEDIKLIQHQKSFNSPTIAWISSTTSETRIPVHEFMLEARSPVLRQALAEFRQSYYYSIPDCLSIEYDKNGQIHLKFDNVHFLSLFNFTLYLYTDKLYDVWVRYRHDTKNASFYRQIRAELIKIATILDTEDLERAARVMVQPLPFLHHDMEAAIQITSFFDTGDVIIQLKGVEIKAHSHILYQRCPFFDSLFHGRAAGQWISSRVEKKEGAVDTVRIDLKHVEPRIFSFVLRYIYADTDEELFDEVLANDLDEFMDLVIDVLSVANELMIDRLAQICQKFLGAFVNAQNVCHLLNAVAPCSVTRFKRVALEYVCLNLGAMLENRLLDDLDPELVLELDKTCQQKLYDSLPLSLGRNTEEYILRQYPEIIPLLEQDKQRRIDTMRLRSHLYEDEIRDELLRARNSDKTLTSSARARKDKELAQAANESTSKTQTIVPKRSIGDLIFQMDDEHTTAGNTPADEPVSDTELQVQEILHTPYPDWDMRTGKLVFARSSPEKGSTVQQAGSPQDVPPASSDDQLEVPPITSHMPWGLDGVSRAGSGLKGLFSEASGSIHAEKVRHESEASVKMSPKLSQKERKRLQKQASFTEQVISGSPSTRTSVAPWSTPLSRPAINQSTDENVTPNGSVIRSMPKNPLTLRQTVPGTPLPQTPSKSGSSFSTPISLPKLPAHNPTTPEKSPSHVRSEATPTSNSTGYTSLAAILYQQQDEKDKLHEITTTKHDLPAIQIEQEFQAWWDQESKRTMMEAEAAELRAKMEQQAKRKTSSSGRGENRRGGPSSSAGRGGGRGRVRGRGGAETGREGRRGGDQRGEKVGDGPHQNSPSIIPKSKPSHSTRTPIATTGVGVTPAEQDSQPRPRQADGKRRHHGNRRRGTPGAQGGQGRGRGAASDGQSHSAGQE